MLITIKASARPSPKCVTQVLAKASLTYNDMNNNELKRESYDN